MSVGALLTHKCPSCGRGLDERVGTDQHGYDVRTFQCLNFTCLETYDAEELE